MRTDAEPGGGGIGCVECCIGVGEYGLCTGVCCDRGGADELGRAPACAAEGEPDVRQPGERSNCREAEAGGARGDRLDDLVDRHGGNTEHPAGKERFVERFLDGLV